MTKTPERDQLAWLASFPDENPNPVLRFDAAGVLRYANAASAPLLAQWGIEVGETPPAPYREEIAQVLASGRRTELEIPLDERMLSLTLAPTPEATYVNAYGLDITAHKRAEAKLQASQQRLQLMFDQSLEGIFFMMLDEPLRWDEQADKERALDYALEHQRITEINDAMLAQYGATREQFLGRTPADFFAHDLAEGRALWRQLFDQGRLHVETRERRLDDGAEVWIEGDYICLYDDDGRITGHFGIQRDVTEHQRADTALRESEETRRMLIESAPVGIVIVDTEGKILIANHRIDEMFGYKREAVIGQPVEMLAPAGLRDRHVRHRQRYMNDPHVRPMGIGLNLEAQRKDGSTFPAEISLGYVQTQRGMLAMAFVMDITPRVEAEVQQARLLRELAHVNQELRDFAYIVSHDLKAPLRAISSLAEWLRIDYEEQLDAEGQELVELLTSRVQRMHNLIEGVLQYSRVGRIREDIVPIDLASLVPEIVDSLAPPPHITVIVAEGLPTVHAERTRIAQVFQNLLSNAIKYLDKPEGHIHVDWEDTGEMWQFSVADNGPGIEEKYYKKIFQLFQTLQPRDVVESTGVGLAIVKKVIELCGGEVWLTSEAGQGTTFYFTLPKNNENTLRKG